MIIKENIETSGSTIVKGQEQVPCMQLGLALGTQLKNGS